MNRYLFNRPNAHDLYGIDLHRLVGGVDTEAEYQSLWKCVKLAEWINGIVVEKVSGCPESFFTTTLGMFVHKHADLIDRGFCTGASGPYRMKSGNVLMPDFAYTQHDRVTIPLPEIADWCPDLCVDVISPGNGTSELEFRRREFFSSGCRLYWEFDPRARTIKTYLEPAAIYRSLFVNDILDGNPVLEGFALPLSDLFDEFDDYFPANP